MGEQIGIEVADKLLQIEAIKLNVKNPFTWASGWKSPIYCDNRLSLSFPDIRTFIKEKLAQLVREKFKNVEAIAGVATAGIPQGCLVADFLGLPFIYVRPKPKEHGMENQIEGKAMAGQKVVVIEDLISTGGSSLKAVKALRQADLNVLGMVAIFTYGFPVSEENLKNENVELHTLSNYQLLLQAAVKKKYIEKESVDVLGAWSRDPAVWKP